MLGFLASLIGCGFAISAARSAKTASVLAGKAVARAASIDFVAELGDVGQSARSARELIDNDDARRAYDYLVMISVSATKLSKSDKLPDAATMVNELELLVRLNDKVKDLVHKQIYYDEPIDTGKAVDLLQRIELQTAATQTRMKDKASLS